ncbi:MAG: putative glycoside hydrolase [Candidatus Paceibacterota bacterium]
MNIRGHEAGVARTTGIVFGACVIVVLGALIFLFMPEGLLPSDHIDYGDLAGLSDLATTSVKAVEPLPVVTHIATPAAVKGIYMTSCVASTPSIRERVLSVMKDTEINALVIDLKDYTGTISYAASKVPAPSGKGCRVADLPEFIARLHKDNIYAIARVTVFQDPLYAAAHPEIAVQSISHPDTPWTDKNRLAYIDPNFPAYWDYIVDISKEGYAIGFDEINFDYIRFPSDGDMSDARFILSASTTKAMAMTDFFSYLRSELAPEGIIMSADLFGQTTVNTDDMGIGQILENSLPYFDYVAPMVYPSHFISNFDGYPNPAEYPYEVVKNTMIRAVERAVAASSSPDKIRPWLQAFDLGAVYTPEMVKKQYQGVYDAGLTSWMLWNAANVYNKEALMPVIEP